MSPTLVSPRRLVVGRAVPSPFVEPPDRVETRPWWQHPATVTGVGLGVLTAVVVAFSLSTRAGDSPDEVIDSEVAPTPPPTAAPSPDPGGGSVDPDPTPGGAPTAPPPILRIEPERPDRAEFQNAVADYVDAWTVNDLDALAALTWSGCTSGGAAIARELDSRLLPSVADFENLLVISANLAVVDLLIGGKTESVRVLFAREGGGWTAGPCPDPASDLAARIELPAEVDQIVALAGLDYSGEDLFQQSLQTRDLAYANFDDADLTRSNLAGSVFEAATFRGADLTEAWVAGATTGRSGADFSGATLFLTFFTDADLTASRFDGVNATEANFTGARLGDVSFRDANLTGAFIDVGSARLVADWTGATCPDGETADVDTGCIDHLNPYG